MSLEVELKITGVEEMRKRIVSIRDRITNLTYGIEELETEIRLLQQSPLHFEMVNKET